MQRLRAVTRVPSPHMRGPTDTVTWPSRRQQQEATGSGPCNSPTGWLGMPAVWPTAAAPSRRRKSHLRVNSPATAPMYDNQKSILLPTPDNTPATRSLPHPVPTPIVLHPLWRHALNPPASFNPSLASPFPYAFSSIPPWPRTWTRTCSSTSIASATLPSPRPSTLSPPPPPPASPAAALAVLAPPPAVASCSSPQPRATPKGSARSPGVAAMAGSATGFATDPEGGSSTSRGSSQAPAAAACWARDRVL